MHRIELTALRSTVLLWEQLVETLPPALESLGLAHDDAATDGEAVVLDRGDEGCVLLLDKVALSRQLALALARRAGVAVDVFEVVGSAGEQRHRFRTAAWRATPAGELLESEGRELDLEDPAEDWGGGPLEVRANRVLDAFADLNRVSDRTLHLGYRRQARARPSSPRVGTLLALLKKAKSYEALEQPDGRVALKVELSTGGRQTSFCSRAELEEVQRLL